MRIEIEKEWFNKNKEQFAKLGNEELSGEESDKYYIIDTGKDLFKDQDTNEVSGRILTKLKFVRDLGSNEHYKPTKLDTELWSLNELFTAFVNTACRLHEKIEVEPSKISNRLLDVNKFSQISDLEDIYKEYIKIAISDDLDIFAWITHQITHSTSWKKEILDQAYLYGNDRDNLRRQLQGIFKTNQIFQSISDVNVRTSLQNKIENSEIDFDLILMYTLLIRALIDDQEYLTWALQQVLTDSEMGNTILNKMFHPFSGGIHSADYLRKKVLSQPISNFLRSNLFLELH